LVFSTALVAGCSDPIGYTSTPDIEDTAAGDSDSAGLDTEDTAVAEDGTAADTAVDVADAERSEIDEDVQVPGEVRVVVARFSWPVGMSSSDTYRLRTSSSGNLVSSAQSSNYRLSAIRFGVGR